MRVLFSKRAVTSMLFRRCLGPEHDLKRLPWYFSARAPCANGGVRRLERYIETGGGTAEVRQVALDRSASSAFSCRT